MRTQICCKNYYQAKKETNRAEKEVLEALKSDLPLIVREVEMRDKCLNCIEERLRELS